MECRTGEQKNASFRTLYSLQHVQKVLKFTIYHRNPAKPVRLFRVSLKLL